MTDNRRKPRKATAEQVRRMRFPKLRWGGWYLRLLAAVPNDNEWYEVAEYAPTTGYQIAKALNLAAVVPEDYDFSTHVEEREFDEVVRDEDGKPILDEDGEKLTERVYGDRSIVYARKKPKPKKGR